MTTHYSVDDDNVAWRVTDDEAIVLHTDSSAYFGLNLSGTLLWARLAERPRTIDQLADWSHQHFTGTTSALRAEISTFIHQLLEGHLLISEDDPDADAAVSQDSPNDSSTPVPWEAPFAEAFGELEKLILSGE